jgi:hypothetical protein
MKLARMLALALLVVSVGAAGCSRDDRGSRLSDRFGTQTNPVAPGDTTPSSAPPPEPPVIQPALFLSYADSTSAGGTASTRWLLGNDSDAPFTMHWTLSSDDGWPELPLEGSVDLGPLSTSQVTIPVPVPASAARGMYGLTILVTRPGGLEYTTEGVVRVWQ